MPLTPTKALFHYLPEEMAENLVNNTQTSRCSNHRRSNSDYSGKTVANKEIIIYNDYTIMYVCIYIIEQSY